MNIRFGLIGFFVASLLLIPSVIQNEVGTSYIDQVMQLSIRAQPTNEKLLRKKLVKGFGTDPSVAGEFSEWIYEASKRHSIEADLIASLISVESSFRKSVVSHGGAVGPAQVKPKHWQDFCGNNDLYDPEQNVYCGAMILSHLMDRCRGDSNCALSAYNVGFYGDRWQAGKRYIAKIDRRLDTLQNLAL